MANPAFDPRESSVPLRSPKWADPSTESCAEQALEPDVQKAPSWMAMVAPPGPEYVAFTQPVGQ